jgi:peptidoglycan/LPS O-acetylase OafA/YrhL
LPKTNNFDLIRLAAALQVALMHAVYLFGVSGRWWRPLQVGAELFPGVPVFFFISGFLISYSFERNPSLRDFARNRCLRIYPALAVCFVVSVAAVWASGYLRSVHSTVSAWLKWTLAQLSIAQFYNPAFMHHYGMGILNASTWTISIELQFYAAVPLLYFVLRLRHLSRVRSNAVLLAIAAAFVLFNVFWQHALDHSRPLYAYLGLSCLPWLYMFLAGVLVQRNFVVMQRLLGGRFLPLAALYCVLALLAAKFLHWRFDNSLNPIVFTGLALVAFAAAFSAPSLADRLLRRNDLSYGVYLYHAPVINLLLFTGIAAGVPGLVLALAVTLVLAVASWWVIERPALSLRRHPVYSHQPVAGPA